MSAAVRTPWLWFLCLASCGPADAGSDSNRRESLDPALMPYQRVDELSGQVRLTGSDTMVNTVSFWARAFGGPGGLYPGVDVEVEGRGSVTAPPALASGKADLGPMSRLMTEEEIAPFETEFGYPPTPVVVAIDGLAIFVHKDNPVDRLTLEQVDAIFSSTRTCGYPEEITTWGQLGLDPENPEHAPWVNTPIEVYGRDDLSGAQGFFRATALCGGEYSPRVLELPGSAAVVHKVGQDRFAIGYSGTVYATSEVKALALARRAGEMYYTWQTANFFSSNHPLSRRMYVYVNKPPDGPVDPVACEFLKFALSFEGQELVLKDGYVPIPADAARRELAKIE